MAEKSDVSTEKARMKSRHIWPFAIWPLLITASFLVIPYPHAEYTETAVYRLLLALSGLAFIILFIAIIKRSERGFTSGILLSVAALSVAVALHNPGVLISVLLFTVMVASNELTVHVIRLSNAEAGNAEERQKMLREFLKGPAMNILKISAAVVFISVGILLLLPVIAIWTSSAYAIVFMGALAGISGYYMLTRE